MGYHLFLGNYSPPVTGNLTASESGSDTAIVSGKVKVQGSFSVPELGGDTAAATGSIKVRGSFSALEISSDTFASSGSVSAIATIPESLDINMSLAQTSISINYSVYNIPVSLATTNIRVSG